MARFRIAFQPGEVSGCNEVAPKLTGPVQQHAELEVLIAHHTGVGGAAGAVLVGEVLDDLFLEQVRFVDQVVGNAQSGTDAAGIHDGLGSAALILGPVDAVLGPQFEGDADHLVALFQQQRRRGGGIHPATHAHQDPLFALCRHRRGIMACGAGGREGRRGDW